MLNPLLRAGTLPTFQKLINGGYSAPLKVTIPPVSIPSWPCLFSGLTPYQLGYCGFTHPEKGVFNSYQWRKNAIFSNSSLRSCVLNIPGTFPAWKINGEMITGMLSPKISYYPKKLEKTINKNWIIEGDNISEIFKAFKIKSEYFLKKLDMDFELLIYVIRLPDSLSHHAHEDPQNILRYIDLAYKKIDDFLAKVLEYKFDNLFIFSDHGLKLYKKEFNVTSFLQKQGLLKFNKSKRDILLSVLLKLYDPIRPLSNTNYLKKIYNNFITILNEKKEVLPKESEVLAAKSHNSRISRYSGNVGGLFLKEKYKNILGDIKQSLESEDRVKRVIQLDFRGFPDLFIVLKENYIFSAKNSLFLTRNRFTLNHQRKGIFISYGKDIKKGGSKSINYFDIAPTILKLYEIGKSEGMIGDYIDILKEK